MADLNVIADVSATLRQVLTEGLSTLTPTALAEEHDLQGNIPSAPARVTLFLFEVAEDPHSRNRPQVRRNTAPDIELSKPPMALLLRYLLTPWAGDRPTEQQILGRVLQVFYDGAILSGPQLAGSLAGTDDALKLTLAPLTLEDRSRIWNAVQRPYRLSVTYEVRVVNLDSVTRRQVRPVASREVRPAMGEEAP